MTFANARLRIRAEISMPPCLYENVMKTMKKRYRKRVRIDSASKSFYEYALIKRATHSTLITYLRRKYKFFPCIFYLPRGNGYGAIEGYFDAMITGVAKDFVESRLPALRRWPSSPSRDGRDSKNVH